MTTLRTTSLLNPSVADSKISQSFVNGLPIQFDKACEHTSFYYTQLNYEICRAIDDCLDRFRIHQPHEKNYQRYLEDKKIEGFYKDVEFFEQPEIKKLIRGFPPRSSLTTLNLKKGEKEPEEKGVSPRESLTKNYLILEGLIRLASEYKPKSWFSSFSSKPKYSMAAYLLKSLYDKITPHRFMYEWEKDLLIAIEVYTQNINAKAQADIAKEKQIRTDEVLKILPPSNQLSDLPLEQMDALQKNLDRYKKALSEKSANTIDLLKRRLVKIKNVLDPLSTATDVNATVYAPIADDDDDDDKSKASLEIKQENVATNTTITPETIVRTQFSQLHNLRLFLCSFKEEILNEIKDQAFFEHTETKKKFLDFLESDEAKKVKDHFMDQLKAQLKPRIWAQMQEKARLEEKPQAPLNNEALLKQARLEEKIRLEEKARLGEKPQAPLDDEALLKKARLEEEDKASKKLEAQLEEQAQLEIKNRSLKQNEVELLREKFKRAFPKWVEAQILRNMLENTNSLATETVKEVSLFLNNPEAQQLLNQLTPHMSMQQFYEALRDIPELKSLVTPQLSLNQLLDTLKEKHKALSDDINEQAKTNKQPGIHEYKLRDTLDMFIYQLRIFLLNLSDQQKEQPQFTQLNLKLEKPLHLLYDLLSKVTKLAKTIIPKSEFTNRLLKFHQHFGAHGVMEAWGLDVLPFEAQKDVTEHYKNTYSTLEKVNEKLSDKLNESCQDLNNSILEKSRLERSICNSSTATNSTINTSTAQNLQLQVQKEALKEALKRLKVSISVERNLIITKLLKIKGDVRLQKDAGQLIFNLLEDIFNPTPSIANVINEPGNEEIKSKLFVDNEIKTLILENKDKSETPYHGNSTKYTRSQIAKAIAVAYENHALPDITRAKRFRNLCTVLAQEEKAAATIKLNQITASTVKSTK